MLQVARLAPNLLQEAADPVARFLREQFNEDGGARDRAGKSVRLRERFGRDLRTGPDAAAEAGGASA